MRRFLRVRTVAGRAIALIVTAGIVARVLDHLGGRREAPSVLHPTSVADTAESPLAQAPEQVIREWLDENGPVSVGMGAIAQTWSLEHLGTDDRRRIETALALAGVESDPSLDMAGDGDLLRLTVASEAPATLPPRPAARIEEALVEKPAAEEPVGEQAPDPVPGKMPRPSAPSAPSAPWLRAPRPVVLGLTALRWTVLGLAVGLVGALGAAKLAGLETMTVMSGSMEPAIHTGDVVVGKPIPPVEARVGDVLTFQGPHGEGRLITHRVRRMRVGGHKVRFVTKGDANNTVEKWQIPDDGKVARVTNRGWKVGYALAFLRDPEKRLFLISIPAVLLGLFELVRIWRPQPQPPARAPTGGHEAAA